MDKTQLKKSTEKALALALIAAIGIFLYVLVSSLIAYQGACLYGQECGRLTFVGQRLSIAFALSWKIILLIGIAPYLYYLFRKIGKKDLPA